METANLFLSEVSSRMLVDGMDTRAVIVIVCVSAMILAMVTLAALAALKRKKK